MRKTPCRTGIRGPPGERGPQGHHGPPGERGPRGERGPEGSSHCHTTISKFLYPSHLIYNSDVFPDLNSLDTHFLLLYNVYPQNGWKFNQGTLIFPVRPNTEFDEIKGVVVNFHSTTATELFSININTIYHSVSYNSEHGLQLGKTYQASTLNRCDYVYDEEYILMHTPTHINCEETVKNITIDGNGEIIVSSVTIVYVNSTVTFYLMPR